MWQSIQLLTQGMRCRDGSDQVMDHDGHGKNGRFAGSKISFTFLHMGKMPQPLQERRLINISDTVQQGFPIWFYTENGLFVRFLSVLYLTTYKMHQFNFWRKIQSDLPGWPSSSSGSPSAPRRPRCHPLRPPWNPRGLLRWSWYYKNAHLRPFCTCRNCLIDKIFFKCCVEGWPELRTTAYWIWGIEQKLFNFRSVDQNSIY